MAPVAHCTMPRKVFFGLDYQPSRILRTMIPPRAWWLMSPAHPISVAAFSKQAGIRSGALRSRTQDDPAGHLDVHREGDEKQDRQGLVDERAEKYHEHPDIAPQPEIGSALEFACHQRVVLVRSILSTATVCRRSCTNPANNGSRARMSPTGPKIVGPRLPS